MRRGDDAFKSIGNKVCCSKHFLSSAFKQSLTGDSPTDKLLHRISRLQNANGILELRRT